MTLSSANPLLLGGKQALVTGGTRGIGAAVAELLAARGATVLVAARMARPEADCLDTPFVAADVATSAGASRIADAVRDELGVVDIVVHCVGASFARPGGALVLTDDDWLQTLNTNFLGAVRVDRILIPSMLERGSGAVVHVSSLQWKRPHPSSPAYGPAKARW